MYPTTMNAIVNEVLRLLAIQRNMLNDMLAEEQLLKESGTQERSMDRTLAQQWIRTLGDEITKVNNLEMTIAVVGTMKAGKSTTINAIVGREVLPNRNRPMTTLPTVIRHKPGQETPHLTFPKPEPFNQALQAIGEALNRMTAEEIDNLSVGATKDGKQLIEDIRTGRLSRLEEEYSGVEGVYSFLKSINDISRLCDANNLNIVSPLEDYHSLSEFPVIEVEFYHLRGQEQQLQGSLSLIDTPGPNEAGQVHLRAILQEQLLKASAVLSVLDYTQLNSEADAEVRQELDYIARYSKDRLFVLVNKFDQKDRNSLGEQDVKGYVGRELFEEEIAADRIFPVSSQFGYLSNTALHALDTAGKLPDNAEWVEDFAEKALGIDWEEDLEDLELVRRGARKLWKKSNFSMLLDQVITESYSKAALFSLSSAVDKMHYYDKEMLQYLKMRSGSVHLDITNLKQLIADLEQDIAKLDQTAQHAKELSSKAIKELTSMTGEVFREGEKVIKELINYLFIHGKRMQEEKLKLENNAASKGMKSRSSLSRLLQEAFILKPSPKSFIPISADGINKFTDKQDAEEFLKKINQALQKDVGVIFDKIQVHLHRVVETLESDLQKGIYDHVNPILEQAAHVLNRVFDLQISFQHHKVKTISVDFDQIFKEAIEEEKVTRNKTRYERRWYTLWLKEHAVSYTAKEQEYHVNTRKIEQQTIEDLRKAHQKLHKELDKYVTQELSQNVNNYFTELKDYLDKFRGNLLDGLADKLENEETLGKLLAAMEGFLSIAELHIEDVKPLLEELEVLNTEVVAV